MRTDSNRYICIYVYHIGSYRLVNRNSCGQSGEMMITTGHTEEHELVNTYYCCLGKQ